MSRLKDEEEPPCVHIISDSEDSNPFDSGFAGFPIGQKRLPSDLGQQLKDPASARKKLKIDGERDKVETGGVEEIAIDIDSISTNPRRTRTKVSSDTSSKFPVSTPSDTMPVAGNRKKYVKNTLPAGAFERMLNEVSQRHPLMTFKEKLEKWNCCEELSDVEDVNNFDDQFQKREQLHRKSTSGRRVPEKDSPHPNYNYQHFRTVILESFKGSPMSTPSPDTPRRQNNVDQPSCSKELETVLTAVNTAAASKPEPNSVIHYEKVLCPSSESSLTKASPSIRLHWTDEESVFRLNRLNPEIDKYSKLIKMRVDYKKEINLKAKMNEIFKTPSLPSKYYCGCDSPEQRNSLEGTSDSKPIKEHGSEVQKVVTRTIETRRSTGSKSADSRRSLEKKTTERRSLDKTPEVSSFQQDEFCNYLGLGMNGKVYSPTPTDNKRRSLRVKRQQQQIESVKKKKEKVENKKGKEDADRGKADEDDEERRKSKEEEVTTTVNESRNSLLSPLTIKILERTTPEIPKLLRPQPPATEVINKSPEIKILLQICNSPPPATMQHTPSTATTVNSVAPPPIRRVRRTRATSNGTSTCPRSSQSDESPSKTTPRRRRLHASQKNHTSDLSESLLSDPQMTDGSPLHNGRISTVPSSEGRKEELPSTSHRAEGADNLHKKFQRYLEESRKTKPIIFIVDSIDNIGSKTEDETTATCTTTNNLVVTEHPVSDEKSHKVKPWSKKRPFHRRLLRINGTMGGGTLNQRILRSRTVMRPLRIKLSKHPMRKKLKAMRKKALEMQLAEEKKLEEEKLQQKLNEDQNLEEEQKLEEHQPVEDEKSESIELLVAENSSIGGVDPLKEEEEHTQTENAIEEDEERCNKTQTDLTSEVSQLVEKLTTEDAQIQTEPSTPPLINFLTSPSSRMQNPLTTENGCVVYAYYELDILTVVQDLVVTFWKTSKLEQVLSKSTCEWIYLGECKRLLYDDEIEAPYKNRICVHNSIPIYMEMRAKELSKIRRDCNLISVYINVYYFHDEDLVAKSHSIQLDTVASLPQSVTFTTITDSRYFILCWSQENKIGKSRSGLCKYSLTPHLDTLASIREFKSMRHEIRYLECTTDDNLIGFGDTQVTLWDHRSGDILMNYDLDFKLGSNYGSIYCPSLEVGQDSTVLIFQKTSAQELSIIAINVSHNAPSHRFVCTHVLPEEFEQLQCSMRTDDYVILTNAEQQELWIDCSDPHCLIQVRTPKGQNRFYTRCKQNVIDIADDHLALESFNNFVLKMTSATEK